MDSHEDKIDRRQFNHFNLTQKLSRLFYGLTSWKYTYYGDKFVLILDLNWPKVMLRLTDALLQTNLMLLSQFISTTLLFQIRQVGWPFS